MPDSLRSRLISHAPGEDGRAPWGFDPALLASTLAYGLFVYLMQPTGVVVMDDEFGYLRSVIETLRFGRPWTDSWLEPWSASLSVLTALLYRITGSFEFAVQGTLGICASGAFFATTVLLLARGLKHHAAILLAALFLSFPTLLWKSVQFTGLALYLPCLLLALNASEKRRWGRFLVFWAIALATRQSAFTWGLLPLAELLRLLRSRGENEAKEWPRVAAVIPAAMGLFFLVQHGMNKTHSQSLITDRMFESLSGLDFLQTLSLGGLFFLCAAGLGAHFASGQADLRRDPWTTRARIAVVCAVGLPLILFDLRTRVQTEHRLLSPDLGWFYGVLVLLIALRGWATGYIKLKGSYVFAAGGSLLVVALRSQVWDYYFLEVGVLGFLSATPPTPILPGTRRVFNPPRWQRASALALAGFHLVFIAQLKGAVDKAYALCRLHEEAVRAKSIEPSEIAKAPFGFHGWYFHPWYATHDGATDRDIAGFHRYLSPGVVIGKKYSWPLHVLPTFQDRLPSEGSEILAMTSTRHLWLFDGRYFLLRLPAEPRFPPAIALSDAYRVPRFPLNDSEWRALIEAPAL